MCVIKLCSVLYGVPIEPSCHNKIHWCVAFRCDHLCDKQMPPLSGINYSRVVTVDKTRHASSYRSQSQVLVKNSDFWPNYGVTVWITPQQLVWKMEKLEWCMKWWRSLRTDYLHKTNMTDRQTDRQAGRQTDRQTDRHCMMEQAVLINSTHRQIWSIMHECVSMCVY